VSFFLPTFLSLSAQNMASRFARLCRHFSSNFWTFSVHGQNSSIAATSSDLDSVLRSACMCALRW
jgi:hypothetical protein